MFTNKIDESGRGKIQIKIKVYIFKENYLLYTRASVLSKCKQLLNA